MLPGTQGRSKFPRPAAADGKATKVAMGPVPLHLFLPVGSRRKGSAVGLLASFSMEMWLFSSFVHCPPHVTWSSSALASVWTPSQPFCVVQTTGSPLQGNLHPFSGAMGAVQLSLQGNAEAFCSG